MWWRKKEIKSWLCLQMYRTDFGTLWEKVRVGCSERTALKQVYYHGWNRSPAQVGCMRQGLRAGALGRPRGMGWGGRWEEGSGWGTHVNPWLIHINVWQKPLQYCKVISLQLIKINGKKKELTVSEDILVWRWFMKWMGSRSTSWNQDCQEKYQQPQICRWHHPYGRKWRGTKKPLESERGEWKSWVKAQHSEN